MGYHLRKIEKRQVGTIEKILEEVEEYQDAMEQGCEIMALVELSDIYGALQLVVERHNKTMDDLKAMATVTRRAFEDGSRKSCNILDRKVFYIDVGTTKGVDMNELKKQMREPGEVQPLSEERDYVTDEDMRDEEIHKIVAEFNAYDKDLRMDLYNTHKGVKITHIPTNLYAECHDYLNIVSNRHQALINLAGLLYDHRQSEKIQEIKRRFKEPLKSPGVPVVMMHTNYGCGCGRGSECCLVKEHIANKFG